MENTEKIGLYIPACHATRLLALARKSAEAEAEGRWEEAGKKAEELGWSLRAVLSDVALAREAF